MKRKIFVVIIALTLLLCSGCSEEATQMANLAKDVAVGYAKKQIEPDGDTKYICSSCLHSFVADVNNRDGLGFNIDVHEDAPYSGIKDSYNKLADDQFNQELNKIVVNGFLDAVFDKQLGITYDTISDFRITLKDMIYYGYIMSHAVLTNAEQSYNVKIEWRPVKGIYEKQMGYTDWRIYAITIDD